MTRLEGVDGMGVDNQHTREGPPEASVEIALREVSARVERIRERLDPQDAPPPLFGPPPTTSR
jgi:hypothetical protein